MATEKIIVGINNEVIELKGADKDAFITQRETDQAEALLLETEYKAKQDARASAIIKLAQASGLSEDEIKLLVGA